MLCVRLGMIALCRRLRINHFLLIQCSLDLSAPEEAYSRNERAPGTLKFGYEGVFKILTTGSISLLVACPRGYTSN